ncbi:MAG: hypothetical protein SFW62_05975 [Alphaproteobacteria bacterium]|nr:hypothetical protein [Alphaproteobacteria bacterium]
MSRTSELPKHLFDTAMEFPRAAAAFFSLAANNLTTREKSIGKERPVLVLPGIGTGDITTIPLRHSIKARGFSAYGWGDGGISRGLTDKEIKTRLCNRLDGITQKHGEKVSVVGWSLGGLLGNVASQLYPYMVSRTISLGSPHIVGMRPDDGVIPGLHRVYNWLNGESPSPEYFAMLVQQSPVPTTSVFSLSDGVVNGHACIRPGNHFTQNIEILGASHCGLGLHPLAFKIVANRLSHAEEAWKPYKAEPGLRLHKDVPVPSRDEVGQALRSYLERNFSPTPLAAA